MNIAATQKFYDASEPVKAISTAELAELLFKAKQAENRAVSHRRELEELLAARFKKVEDGSFTERVGGMKINIKYPVSRKLDLAKLDAISTDLLPVEMRPVKVVRELDVTQMRYLQNNEPEMYRVCASAITATPGKTAVTVEYIEE